MEHMQRFDWAVPAQSSAPCGWTALLATSVLHDSSPGTHTWPTSSHGCFLVVDKLSPWGRGACVGAGKD